MKQSRHRRNPRSTKASQQLRHAAGFRSHHFPRVLRAHYLRLRIRCNESQRRRALYHPSVAQCPIDFVKSRSIRPCGGCSTIDHPIARCSLACGCACPSAGNGWWVLSLSSSDHSDVPQEKLRDVLEVLDSMPVFSAADLALLIWAATITTIRWARSSPQPCRNCCVRDRTPSPGRSCGRRPRMRRQRWAAACCGAHRGNSPCSSGSLTPVK